MGSIADAKDINCTFDFLGNAELGNAKMHTVPSLVDASISTPLADGRFLFLGVNGQRRAYIYDQEIADWFSIPRFGYDESVAGLWTFTRSGAPFAVLSSVKVNSLNADLLDGYHASIVATGLTVMARDGSGLSQINDPVGDLDVANRRWVLSVAAGSDTKASVRVGTTVALPTATEVGLVLTADANGILPSVDGVTLVATDELLVKDNGDTTQHGLWVVTNVGTGGTPWILTRRSDMDADSEISNGSVVFIEEGSTQASQKWSISTADPINIGDAHDWTLTSTSFQAIAGNGIVFDGNIAHFAQISPYTIGSIFYADGTASMTQMSNVKWNDALGNGYVDFDSGGGNGIVWGGDVDFSLKRLGNNLFLTGSDDILYRAGLGGVGQHTFFRGSNVLLILDEVPGHAEFSLNVVPDSDVTYDLGTPSERWDNLYVANLQLTQLTLSGLDVGVGTEPSITLQRNWSISSPLNGDVIGETFWVFDDDSGGPTVSTTLARVTVDVSAVSPLTGRYTIGVYDAVSAAASDRMVIEGEDITFFPGANGSVKFVDSITYSLSSPPGGFLIKTDTTDGADLNWITISGGGGPFNPSRGAYLSLNGNDLGGTGGKAILAPGDAAGAILVLRDRAGVEVLTIADVSPEITLVGDLHVTKQILMPDGITGVLPPYSFASDPGTGMYLGGAGTLAWSSGGSTKAVLTSTAFQTNVNIMPGVSSTYDLGSAITKWKDLHLGGVLTQTGAGENTFAGPVKFNEDMELSGGKFFYLNKDGANSTYIRSASGTVNIGILNTTAWIFGGSLTPNDDGVKDIGHPLQQLKHMYSIDMTLSGDLNVAGNVDGVSVSGLSSTLTNHLSGATEDHSQYFLLDGSRDVTGNLTITKTSPILTIDASTLDGTLDFQAATISKYSIIYDLSADYLTINRTGVGVAINIEPTLDVTFGNNIAVNGNITVTGLVDGHDIDDHITTDNIHRILNDGAQTTTNLWSASKIQAEIDTGGGSFQPLDDDLTQIAGIANIDGDILATESGLWIAKNGGAARTYLGLGIGTDVQAHSDRLDEIAGLAPTNSNIIVGSGSSWVAESGSTARASLGLSIGGDVQAWDANLSQIAALSVVTDAFIVGSGSVWGLETASGARSALSLSPFNTVTFGNVISSGYLHVDGAADSYVLGSLVIGLTSTTFKFHVDGTSNLDGNTDIGGTLDVSGLITSNALPVMRASRGGLGGSGNSTTYVHGLGTRDIVVQCRDNSTHELVLFNITATTTSSITLSANDTVAWSNFSVTVIG